MLSLPTSLLNLRRFKLRSGIANQELGWSTALIWGSVDSSVKHPPSSQPEAMLAATKAGVCPIADTFVPPGVWFLRTRLAQRPKNSALNKRARPPVNRLRKSAYRLSGERCLSRLERWQDV
jgi:hypothetical protein